MSELKKCPFCGEEAYISQMWGEDSEKYWYRVGCTVCGMGLLPHSKTIKEQAIAAWNRRAQPENEPLTLEELRQMDGEPVWVVTLDGTDEPRWEIVVSAGKCGIDLICVINGVETMDYADLGLYGDTWLAYRAKPERSEG